VGLFLWIVFGLIAGALAKWIMPGPDPGGCVVTTLLGVGGACVGGYLGVLVGFGDITGFDLRSMALAVVGAIVILAVYRMLVGRTVR
jgi:uncharacterized membrane protein YeaQ/YmgE (transglycosylase-associated protein family)